MRPLRVGFVTPNLMLNGVYQWICDLASNTETQRISWIGGLITGSRVPDPLCAARLSRLMPLHCWHIPNWVAAFDLVDSVKVHYKEEDAYQTLKDADVVIAWEVDEHLHWFFRHNIPVVLVSHTTWWQPQTELTRANATLVAVSEVAAQPWREAGLQTEIIHSGISWDRIASTAGRENVRKFWKAGPGHFVTACLDRHAPEKRPQLLPYLMRSMSYQHLAVMYGADQTGNPAAWLVEESLGLDRVFFHAPIENVGDVYAGADLIFTGSNNEAFGQTIFEGIAAGKPVVANENLGVVPELEILFGGPLVYAFPTDHDPGEIGELIETIRESKPDLRDAQAFVREYLSARRGASRWTEFLSRFRVEHIPVASWGREERFRWRTPSRMLRGLLLCRNLTELKHYLQHRPEDTTWVAAMVLDSASLLESKVLHGVTVITDLDGPAWCHKHADLAPAVHRLAILCDYAFVSLDEDHERIFLGTTKLPAIRNASEIHKIPTAPVSKTKPKLRAALLCTSIGHGGTERWAEQLFSRGAAAGIEWVGCCSVDFPSRNEAMSQRYEELGVEVRNCVQRRDAMTALAEWKPDIVVYTGLERIGQCIPPGYGGPVIAVAHNSGHDYYTRAWAFSSDPFTSHSVAVSYLAALAFPMERRDDVVVLYPGVEIVDHRSEKSEIRKELGFTDHDIVICFAGRADANKRPDLLARAIATLPSRYKFLHIGNLSEWEKETPYLEILRKLLPGRFRWLEFTDQLDRILAGADMLVLCSQHESFGLVLMQALQQGCSVIGPTKSAVGELKHDPNWVYAPWTVFDGDSAAELALRIEGLHARPRHVDLPPVARYFSADTAAWNFHQFMRHTLKNPTGTGRIQLRQLRQSPVSMRGLPNTTAVCDAVLPLGPDPLQNELSARELLQQTESALQLHVVGAPNHIAKLQASLSSDHVKYYPAQVQSWFGAFMQCRHAISSEFVLDAAPGIRNAPERSHQSVNFARNECLEALVDFTTEDINAGRACFRRQTLIDFWLSGVQAGTLAEFQEDAKAKGRPTLVLPRQQAHKRQPFTDTPFCLASEVPALPGRVPDDACAAVLPFRGRTDWAKAAVEGLLSQEDATVTIHLVDDATETREADKFLTWAKKFPNIKTYRAKRNIGQFMCANAVLARNHAECWLIQDADDISDPHRAWRTYHGLRESGADIFTAPVLAFGGAMRVLSATYPCPGSWYFAINPVCGFTQGAFQQLGGYFDFNDTEVNKASLDTDFFLRAAARDLTFYVAATPLLYYRQHIASCTSSKDIGIASPKRVKLEREIAMRQSCETLRYIRGSYRQWVDMLVPY